MEPKLIVAAIYLATLSNSDVINWEVVGSENSRFVGWHFCIMVNDIELLKRAVLNKLETCFAHSTLRTSHMFIRSIPSNAGF